MMMHLDIGVADLDAGVEWATTQGARLADEQPQEGVRVMLDPTAIRSACSPTTNSDARQGVGSGRAPGVRDGQPRKTRPR